MSGRRLSCGMAVAAMTLAISAAQSAVLEVTPAEDLRAAIAGLRPGDTLEMGGGTYQFDSGFRITVNGTVDAPITIRAKPGERPVVYQANAGHNVIEISGSSYVTFSEIGFTGGSHGVRLMDSDFVTIEDCEIWETGDVALSANSGGTYEGLRILRNHIHHTNGTGEGMYLGCNSDACRVANSLIEGNYIHHTNRPGVEQGDGIELKEGSYGNTIRDNVIHDTNYPGIITYSTVGNGPRNVIEGNVIWNTNDYAIQSAADSVIRNNIVLGSPVALQPHQAGSPANQEVLHNTIVNSGSGIEVRGVVGPILIANNAVYSQSGEAIRLISGSLGQVTLAGNVVVGGVSGSSSGYSPGRSVTEDFVDGHFRGSPPIELFPSDDSALIGAGADAYRTTTDFNGTTRTATDAGAYQWGAAGNTGWTLSESFKRIGGEVPPRPPSNVQVR